MNTARTWLISKLGDTAEPTQPTPERPDPTPLWVVIVLAVFLLPLAVGAFTLSFWMLLPVMILAGWSASVAWLGPAVIDIAAGAGAFIRLAVRNPAARMSGMLLLLASTGLSIVGNLAGHAIERPHGQPPRDLPPELVGAKLPAQWNWVVELLSIAAPLFVAGLVHAFGHVLLSHLQGRRQPASVRRTRTVEPARRPRTQHPTDGEPKAASTPAPPPVEVDAAPSEKTNVTPLQRRTDAGPGPYEWFAAQVDAADGDVYAVDGPGLAAHFNKPYLKTKISDFRARYRNERAAANQ